MAKKYLVKQLYNCYFKRRREIMDYKISKTDFGENQILNTQKPAFLEELGEEGLKSYLVIFMI